MQTSDQCAASPLAPTARPRGSNDPYLVAARAVWTHLLRGKAFTSNTPREPQQACVTTNMGAGHGGILSINSMARTHMCVRVGARGGGGGRGGGAASVLAGCSCQPSQPTGGFCTTLPGATARQQQTQQWQHFTSERGSTWPRADGQLPLNYKLTLASEPTSRSGAEEGRLPTRGSNLCRMQFGARIVIGVHAPIFGTRRHIHVFEYVLGSGRLSCAHGFCLHPDITAPPLCSKPSPSASHGLRPLHYRL